MKVLQDKAPAILLCSLFIIFFLSCSSQSKIPDSWQPDMVLKMDYGGGMRNYSSTLEIKDTGSYLLVNEDGKTRRSPLSFSKKELDELVKFLKTKKFDLIRSASTGSISYDMATTRTSLQWGKNRFEIARGATENISKASEGDYFAVIEYINKLLDNK